MVSGTVIRIDPVVIADRVGAADSSFLLFLSDGMNRHQPEDRDAEIFELIEPGGDRVEVSLLRKSARIVFVRESHDPMSGLLGPLQRASDRFLHRIGAECVQRVG